MRALLAKLKWQTSYRGLATMGLMVATVVIAGCDKGGTTPTAATTAPVQPSSVVSQDPPDPEGGREVYLSGCVTCHGHNLDGMPHQGPSLKRSTFVANHTDAELIAFIQKGRPKGDPTNTSGNPMPPNGNIPNLKPPQIADVVAYIRQTQAEAKAEAVK